MSESMVSQHPGVYQDMLTIHRSGHFSAGKEVHVVKLLFVDFDLRLRHRLHDKQDCKTYFEI